MQRRDFAFSLMAAGTAVGMIGWLTPQASAAAPPAKIVMPFPAALTDGPTPATFTGEFNNFSGIAYAHVRVDFTISDADKLIKAGQVTLEYDHGGTYEPITLSQAGTSLVGAFPSPTGFSLPDSTSKTQGFEVFVDGVPDEALTVSSALDQVNAGGTVTGTLATATNLIGVTTKVSLGVPLPASLRSGAAPTSFIGTLANGDTESAGGFANSEAEFLITNPKADLVPANVTVAARLPGGSTYTKIPLVSDGHGGLLGELFPAAGITLTPGFTASIPFEASVDGLSAQDLTVASTVVQVNSAGSGAVTSSLYNAATETVLVLPATTPPPPPPPHLGPDTGYHMVAGDGGLFEFGSAQYHGSLGDIRLNQPIVAIAKDPVTNGYWMVAGDGGIFDFDAPFYGSLGNIRLNQPIVAMASTPDGKGYWLVAKDGGLFDFGDAKFYGSLGDIHLNQPITGIATTPDGKGYWMVATDGGIFEFGDAKFHGSLGNIHLNKPVVAMTEDPLTGGYWLAASDGGIFDFDAPFYGSLGDIHLNKPVVAIVASPDGKGYGMFASDGGVFEFGDFKFFGSLGNIRLNQPVVGASL